MNEIRDIHDPLCRWLDKNRIPFHRNRPDKKTTAIKGDPDFLCTLANRCIYVECKVPGKKPSEDQEKRIAYLRRAGNTVRIAYSCEEAIAAVSEHFGVINDASEPPAPEKRPPVVRQDGDSKGPRQFIGNIAGKDYVLIGDPGPGGQATLLRTATAADLINIPRR